MITKGTLGAVTTTVAVDGSASVMLMKHRVENRMVPVLRYVGISGTEHVVELSTPDVVNVVRSLVVLFSAEQPEIATWWRELTARQ